MGHQKKNDEHRPDLSYALITPARNEADLIEGVLKSVIAQTFRPVKWVIVSDGSDDGTDEIVLRYAEGRDWIELLRLPEHRERNFAAKATAIDAGLERLKGIDYDIVGNLDADVTFGADYFSYLIGKFEELPQLGVAGTHYTERDGRFHSFHNSRMSADHVNGAVQMFRRECFEQVGGYTPIRGGGIDWVAVTTARMKGWMTRSFGDQIFEHHRPIGTAETNSIGSRFHYGRKDYFLGGHPLWQLARAGFQMVRKPYVIGGLALFCGYWWSWLTGVERPISKELMQFHRAEQLERLKKMLFLSGRSNARS
ncbi:MAG: glycosyltransferase family 2 protein [Gammaproteobacteria bacterium]